MSLPRDRFAARLAAAPLLADGAMGTLLFSRGIPQRACLDELADDPPGPDRRRSIASTSTPARTSSRPRPSAPTGSGSTPSASPTEAGRFNRRAAQVAREARDVAGRDALVGGCIGPLGPPTRELRHPDEAVDPRGVPGAGRRPARGRRRPPRPRDLLRPRPPAARRRRGARRAADLPIVASLTFGEDLVLADGTTPAAAAAALADGGRRRDRRELRRRAASPASTRSAQLGRAGDGEPARSILPNAGLPQRIEGQFVYARGARRTSARWCRGMLAAGARDRRRLLRHDARPHRGDARRARRR